MDSMDSLMEIFITETNTFLNTLENILLESEKAENGIRSSTNEIFRIMHTIKSSSAMMSLDNISKLTHKLEDLFAYIREHEHVEIDDSMLTDIVLDGIDFIKRNMEGKVNEDPSDKISTISKFLEDIKSGKPVIAESPKIVILESAPDLDDYTMDITISFKAGCQMVGLRAFEIQKRLTPMCEKLTAIPDNAAANDAYIQDNGFRMLIKTDKNRDEIRMTFAKSPFIDDYKVKTLTPEPPKSEREIFAERKTDRTRPGLYASVEIGKLDYLVDLVSELLLSQMSIADDIERGDHTKIYNSVVNLKKLVLKLQETTLSTRMISVKETFLKMNRIVRDMSRSLNKDVEFTILGEDIEVDRSIIENLSSPLMHIIRNSVDHGIEDAATRISLGKPAKGKLELKAYNEGRNVVITVTDDGKGFDSEKILAKAISGGLITESDAGKMTEEDIYSLVYHPGFSTNANVTEYSGRGVGMDVVNENMRRMNGKVIIRSKKNVGSALILKIPLTLTIIDVLILNVGSEICAIPVSSIMEIFSLKTDTDVRNINGEDMILWRGECCRILNLYDFFTNIEPVPYTDGVMIMMNDGSTPYAVFAQAITDHQDVVVKPAPNLFKSIKGISGCTLLGNGQISFILDTGELLLSINRKRSFKDE